MPIYIAMASRELVLNNAIKKPFFISDNKKEMEIVYGKVQNN